MITVSESCEKIINRSRYLTEAISKNLINISSLARYMKPEVEEMLQKKVSYPSLIMALNRLSRRIKPKYVFKNIFKNAPELIVRSNLIQITIANSPSLIGKCASLETFGAKNKYFFTITVGIFETTIIVSQDLKAEIKNFLKGEVITGEFNDLSSITIQLPKESILTPGIFNFFLKSLAWEGINIIEIVSSHLELTIIVDKKETNRAFGIIQSLFAKDI